MLFLVNVLVPKTKWPTREGNNVVEIKKGQRTSIQRYITRKFNKLSSVGQNI